MKKTFFLLASLLVVSLSVQAKNGDRIIQFKDLPAMAQEFVNTYFPKETVRLVKMEDEVTKTEYTVRFESGVEVEFNSVGEWKEIDGQSTCLPTGFLEKNILQYLEQKHPGHCLKEISRGKHKYDLELANGMELIFNKAGEFLRYDD